MNELITVLGGAGHEPVVLAGQVVILPFGGRVIGLFPEPETNVLWTNPGLRTIDGAREVLRGPGWINIGGDRTWISPEIDTLVNNPEHMMDGYVVPRAMDPGDYTVMSRDDCSAVLESSMAVRFRRSGETVGLTVNRSIEVLETPPVDLPTGVAFAGYRQQATLTVAGTVTARPGLWQLLQVTGGGEVILPLREGARPRAFIGRPIYELSGNHLRCRVVTDESFKLSLTAEDSRGLMAYLKRDGNRELLVVRRFPVADAARYADVPCADPGDSGHVQQLYVDNGDLGGFGELEYHSPAIDAAAGPRVTDSSEVWAFVGTGLTELAERLVSYPSPAMGPRRVQDR